MVVLKALFSSCICLTCRKTFNDYVFISCHYKIPSEDICASILYLFGVDCDNALISALSNSIDFAYINMAANNLDFFNECLEGIGKRKLTDGQAENTYASYFRSSYRIIIGCPTKFSVK
jgi:hypothetical protein